MYKPLAMRVYNPEENQKAAYTPYEESGDATMPSKTIFEEEMYKEYVVPFEYEKSGGTYRYGVEVLKSTGALFVIGIISGVLLYHIFKK